MPVSDVRFDQDRRQFVCTCGVPHGPVSGTDRSHVCCSFGCCRVPTWPGRQPRAGDLALCWDGTLGLVTSAKEDRSCTGVHLSTLTREFLSPWQSSRPAVLEHDIWSFLERKRKNRALCTPYLHLGRIEGWPSQLIYLQPSHLAEFKRYFTLELSASLRKGNLS